MTFSRFEGLLIPDSCNTLQSALFRWKQGKPKEAVELLKLAQKKIDEAIAEVSS